MEIQNQDSHFPTAPKACGARKDFLNTSFALQCNPPQTARKQKTPIVLRSLDLTGIRKVLLSIARVVTALAAALAAWCRTSAELRLENLALRQQLAVLRRSAPKRLRLTKADRAFWVWLKRVWARWDKC